MWNVPFSVSEDPELTAGKFVNRGFTQHCEEIEPEETVTTDETLSCLETIRKAFRSFVRNSPPDYTDYVHLAAFHSEMQALQSAMKSIEFCQKALARFGHDLSLLDFSPDSCVTPANDLATFYELVSKLYAEHQLWDQSVQCRMAATEVFRQWVGDEINSLKAFIEVSRICLQPKNDNDG